MKCRNIQRETEHREHCTMSTSPREGSLWTNKISQKSGGTLQNLWNQRQFRSLGVWGKKCECGLGSELESTALFKKRGTVCFVITTKDNEGTNFEKFCAESFLNFSNLHQDISSNMQETICVNTFVITWSVKAVHEAKSLPMLLEIMALGRNPKQG